MNFTRLGAVLCGLMCLSSLAGNAFARQGQNDTLATMQELRDLFDKQEWQALLQKTSPVLSLRGAALQNYDRYDVLMMRGEAQLQLKASQPAIAAFKDASDETQDPEKVSTARASVMLLKRGTAFQFTRKSPTSRPADPKTYDLLDRSERKDAFVALAADEAMVVEPKAKAAATGKSLKPIADMFQAVESMRDAELAGTGKTEHTDAIITPLALHATQLSADELAKQKQRVDKIEKSANQVIDYDTPNRNRGTQTGPGTTRNPGGYQTEKRYKKQGLIGTDSNDLKDAISICKKIGEADSQLAGAFGDAIGKPLLDVAKQSTELQEKAHDVLTADYSHSSSDPAGVK